MEKGKVGLRYTTMGIIETIVAIEWKKKICEFLVEKGICKGLVWVIDKIKPTPIHKAYKEALKKWDTHHYVKGYYKEHRLETFADFSKYVMSMDDLHGDADMDMLFGLFEEELKKDDTTYNYLIELREKAIELGVEHLIKEAIGVKYILNEHAQLLHEIKEIVSSHFKGQRGPFTYPEEYTIQRYCSYKFDTDDYVKCFLEHREIKPYPLVDYVLGNTECKANRFVLYSDAHSGKTTELKKLCYDLQQNGMYVPILFELKHHPNLVNDLPAFGKKDDRGVVLIIDALDECYNGEERNTLFNELEGYAKEHPQMKIVLSCRSNHQGESKLEGYKPLVFEGIGQKDVEAYLKSCGQENLIADIINKGLQEFARTPFNLTSLVGYYKDKKQLPENKADLYDYFIDVKLKKEKEKRIRRSTIKLEKSKSALQTLAIALQLLEVNYLNEEKVNALLDSDYELLDALLRTSFIDVKDGEYYGFSHNSYKEHLVAKFLYSIGDILKIQQLCCYQGTKNVKASWYNTVALMLSSMPKDNGFSIQIKNWIVEDNQEMVLYIDQKMLSTEQRTDVLIGILEKCKEKDLSFGDFYTSQYRELMEFGYSDQTVDYLENELKACKKRDYHMVNLLFLLRYLPWQKISQSRKRKLESTMVSAFGRLIKQEDTAYPLYVAFRNPWLLRREVVDKIFKKIKDSTHPEVVNEFVEYVNESGCSEEYTDIIIDMGKYIHNYRHHGAICCVSRRYLYDAYKTVSTWENIQKVLRQLVKELADHRYSCDSDIRDFNDVLTALLHKVSVMVKTCPERTDFVYEVLIEMAEERRDLKLVGTDPFVDFFEQTGTPQHYYELSLEKMKEKLFDRHEWGDQSHEYYKLLEAYAYCASLFLTEERIENSICSEYKNDSFEGYHVLSWLHQTATDDMKEVIETILRSRYPSHWIDPNKPNAWDLKRKKDFDELLDYEKFKAKVLMVVDEKSPRNRDDIKVLRKVKVKFSDEEEDIINNYVFGILYDFSSADDTINLEGVRKFIENEKAYRKLVVAKTVEKIYNDNNETTLSAEQQDIFKNAVIEWLEEIGNAAFNPYYLHKCPAIKALLHHGVSVDKSLLLKLLPYSCHSIYIKEKMYYGSYYHLFDYIREQFEDDEETMLRSLRSCMNRSETLVEENQKLWGKYLINTNKTTEYQRVVRWVKKMESGDAVYTILKAMIEKNDTRELVKTNGFLRGLSAEKKRYVYELLASDNTLDEFVRIGMERVFNRLDNGEKERAMHFLLAKGSIKALRYLSNHLEMFGRNYAMHYSTVEALPLLIKLYVATIGFEPRYDYSCILNAMEEIATTSDENWFVVKSELDELIEKDRKFVRLNWYLDKWETLYWERQNKMFSIEDVKKLLL